MTRPKKFTRKMAKFFALDAIWQGVSNGALTQAEVELEDHGLMTPESVRMVQEEIEKADAVFFDRREKASRAAGFKMDWEKK